MTISFLQRHPKIAAGHIIAEDNLGAMLIEILELYGTRFNFEKVGLAIDNEGSYFDKLEMQDISVNANVWKKICIRDPNDRTNNIAKATHQVDNVIQVFGDAFRELTKRCYLVHAKIGAGEDAPWGTKSGSILDAIIDRPQVSTRDRLRGLWKESMGSDVEGTTSGGEVLPGVVIAAAPPQKTKTRPNRAQRRAAHRTAEESALKKRLDVDSDDALRSPIRVKSPVRAKSPTKNKAPTAVVPSGTKDEPILLDDTPPPSPRRKPKQPDSPFKRKNRFVEKAVRNLQTTGSISGGSRETISLD